MQGLWQPDGITEGDTASPQGGGRIRKKASTTVKFDFLLDHFAQQTAAAIKIQVVQMLPFPYTMAMIL
jgi:hypothetical protein